MKRFLGCLATLALAFSASAASAAPASLDNDPIGALIGQAITSALQQAAPDFLLKATLYHAGEPGMSARDSLGCKVVAMRTAAVDGRRVPRHTVLFIKQTVGLPMPGGGVSDGFWYASDLGSAIHAGRIDLFTGQGAASMVPLLSLNLATLSVVDAGTFAGCPPR
ncbi:MAG TPA: 3D domain-containing protein [Caulobacteraceae bacterium]|nr:3D domain-containing protein [Caulobacteraceae bacterium]